MKFEWEHTGGYYWRFKISFVELVVKGSILFKGQKDKDRKYYIYICGKQTDIEFNSPEEAKGYAERILKEGIKKIHSKINS